MKKILVIILVNISLTVAQEINLTLEESLSLGLKNSKELSISNSKILRSEASVSEISSSMLPKISLSAGYTHLSDVPPFEVDLPILPQPVTIQESVLDNYSAKLKLEQPIFTGFRLSSLKSSAELILEANTIQYERDKIIKVDNIIKSFWQFYITQQIVNLLKENLATLKEHQKNTERFLENGLVTKNDFLKIKVEVANLNLKLIDAENNNALAKASFNKTIGLQINSNTNIIVDINDMKLSTSSYDLLLEKALNQRQELKSTKFMLKAIEEKEDAANAEWYPQLFAFGEFNYANPNQRFMPLQNEFNDSWAAGLALKWNVWNWGGTSARVEQVRQEYLQASSNFELLKENIEIDVYKNYLNVEKAVKKIELSNLQVESANENYRITKQKYYQQLATSTDLIDAENSLLQAKTNLLTSKVGYKIAISSLNKSIGKVLN